MILITNKYVTKHDNESIKVVYQNKDTWIFNISYEEFIKELSTKHVI